MSGVSGRTLAAGLLAGACLAWAGAAGAAPDPGAEALEILKRSIGFRTVIGAGQVPAYADYLKSVLVEAGFAPGDFRFEPVGETGYLTARYPGSDPKLKPILLLGHMDVVEAKPADWKRDPFTAVVEGGYVYGRGSLDNKSDVSILVATLAKLRREGWRPRRDVILALSGDEETTMASTARLAQALKGAELALNGDGGGGELSEDGKPVIYSLQGAEKTYADFAVSVTDPGGHSSTPTPGNPIYRLAAALSRVQAYRFPVMTNELTLAYFKASAQTTPAPLGEAMKRFAETGDAAAAEQLSARPEHVGKLRTTCVATQIEGGHAPNALPQRAAATINCRIFPGTPVKEVQATLAQVMADASISITEINSGAIESPASPLRPDVLNAVTKAVQARYPRLQVVPSMTSGATDGMYFRAAGVPTYGVSSVFIKPSDEFAHGLDERLPIATLAPGVTQWERVLKALAK